MAVDLNQLFARAEQSFAAGRADAARADLEQVLSVTGDHPAVLHLLALVEKRRGAIAAAHSAFDRALKLDRRNPEIAVNAGNFYFEIDDYEAGLAAYSRALSARSHRVIALRGQGACLRGLGRNDEARAAYRHAAALAPDDPKTWVALGAFERGEGNLDASADAFDQALAAAPAAPVALHGRARVALERGEESAASRFDLVTRLLPDDQHAALGAVEALVPLDRAAALERMKALVDHFPNWVDGHIALARLRWEGGDEREFASSMEQLLKEQPCHAEIWRALVGAYSGVDRYADAADTAAKAQATLGVDPAFQLLEAANASEAGQIDRANGLFAGLAAIEGRDVVEAKHLLRTGNIDRAAALLDRAREAVPDDIATWAFTGLVWRLTADQRADWLFNPDKLIAVREVDFALDIDAITSEVEKLHHSHSFPIGQSLRGGTQTRGRLFDMSSPLIAKLRDSIRNVVEAYWRELPAEDLRHPLLRWRDARPRFAGSWSVRLTDGGFHISHIHPRGLLSSACYLQVPKPIGGTAGWLEVGCPPSRMGLGLAPLRLIEPIPGRLALFPSYIHHGTVPFTAGKRLSIAFDIIV